MLSGPDLGGGFLHQLSVDHEGDATIFTYHAQDGGSDAGGPAPGPLDVFGYVHSPSPCMFGGPRCWHRRFRLPQTDSARVRMAYNRGRFVLEAMLGQVYRDVPASYDAGTKEVVDRIAPGMDREGIPWYVGGSMAARLLGAPVEPNHLDLGTTRTGVDRLGTLLHEYLIEPVAPTDWPERGIVRGGRAFVGTFKEGLRVEWAISLDPGAAERPGEWSGHPEKVRTETARVGDREIRVTRPEYALVRHAEKGRPLAGLLDFARSHGPDLDLLAELLRESSLGRAEQEKLTHSLVA
jgi:hypothetical protein